MSATSVVERGRRAAEVLMVDACTIRRQTGQTTDPDTGVVTPMLAVIYTGKCRVNSFEPYEQTPTAGEHAGSIQRYRLFIPLATPADGVEVDDVAEITSSALDLGLVGRLFRIAAHLHKTHATARRFAVEETTS